MALPRVAWKYILYQTNTSSFAACQLEEKRAKKSIMASSSRKKTCKICGLSDGHTLIDCPFKCTFCGKSVKSCACHDSSPFGGRNKKLGRIITWSGRWTVDFAAFRKERKQKRGVRRFLFFFLLFRSFLLRSSIIRLCYVT